MRRIVGKAISWSLSTEIQHAAGPLQVATGLKGGAEAAIHSMRDIFNKEACDAVILVDAENAFNKLNRRVALHNIQYICPPFATVLINTESQQDSLSQVGEKYNLQREQLRETLWPWHFLWAWNTFNSSAPQAGNPSGLPGVVCR